MPISLLNILRVVGRTRIFFAILTVVGFFVAAELALWAVGVRPLIAERDPYGGFSSAIRVFEKDETRGVWHTPPRAVRHSFAYQEFAIDKPENGFRLFTLGGSTAVGFPWGAEVAFTHLLGVALAQEWPDREVEAVNAAAMSYGSHRLRILTDEILDHDPDLLIVYTGHNEFVERTFYRDQLHGTDSRGAVRGVLFRSRLASAIERLLAPEPEPALAGEEREATALLGLDVERDYSTEVGSAERKEAVRLFEENLRAIVAAAADAGVPVVLCSVPSNLRDWKPNQSHFSAERTAADRTRVQDLIERSGLDPQAAVEATRMAPEYAAAWFAAGRAHLASGELDEARDSFRLARDRDARPSRAIDAINDAIARVASGTGARFLDVASRIDERSPHGIPGYDQFEDYVHLKPDAHREVAFRLWEAIVGRGADRERFELAIGNTGREIRGQTPQMLFNTAVVLENRGDFAQAIEKYSECLAANPGYYLAAFNRARLLARAGRHEPALADYERVLGHDPDLARAWIGLGDAARELGRKERALSAYRRGLELDPDSAHGWSSLGILHSAAGRYEEAEDAFRRAVAQDPGRPENHVHLGLVRLSRGDLEAARDAFDAALERRPGDPGARNGLAAVLVERGELDRAEAIFREVLAVRPDDPFARGGLERIRRRRAGG